MWHGRFHSLDGNYYWSNSNSRGLHSATGRTIKKQEIDRDSSDERSRRREKESYI